MTLKDDSARLAWSELLPARMLLAMKQPGHELAWDPDEYALALWIVLEQAPATMRSQILAGLPAWRLAYTTLKGKGERALVDLIERSLKPSSEEEELASVIGAALVREDVDEEISKDARNAVARALIEAGYSKPAGPEELPT